MTRALAFVSLMVAAQSVADPVVIAHRGASGYLPEHTLEAYAMAYAMHPDFIEPDLVLTKDKQFVCMHDIHLEATTNVEEVFPDGHREDGRWYAADFTLAEIKSLAVHERLPKRFPQGALICQVPTFEEVLALVEGLNQTTGLVIGVYPELKAPGFHRKEGLPMEEAFLAVLRAHDLDRADAAICVQSFEPDALKRLRELGCKATLMQCINGTITEAGLDAIKQYAQGIIPDKGKVVANPQVVAWAHDRGLSVHAYTLRADDVPAGVASFDDEMELMLKTLGVDGVYTDFPDKVVAWIDQHPELAKE